MTWHDCRSRFGWAAVGQRRARTGRQSTFAQEGEHCSLSHHGSEATTAETAAGGSGRGGSGVKHAGVVHSSRQTGQQMIKQETPAAGGLSCGCGAGQRRQWQCIKTQAAIHRGLHHSAPLLNGHTRCVMLTIIKYKTHKLRLVPHRPQLKAIHPENGKAKKRYTIHQKSGLPREAAIPQDPTAAPLVSKGRPGGWLFSTTHARN